MATNYSPKIVTQGLVSCFDASNPKSYPRAGNIWYDLSGTKNHATFAGTPAYSGSLGGGSIYFTGNSATFNNSLNQSNLSQEWTISGWINITDKVSQVLMGGVNNGCSICYSQGNNSLLYLNGGADDYYTYGGDLGGLGWVYSTFRFKNADGSRTIYKNLTDISTGGPNNTSTPVGLNSTFTIGSGVEGCIGHVLIYNRYITNAELEQNFNTTRSRFGV